MKTQVTVHEKLRNLRLERGLTLEQLAEAVSISKSTLASYESNEFKDISHTSLIALAKFYGVSTDYLLGIVENRDPQNVELLSLHLSDDMLALLQSESINHRLLCKLVTHPAFPAMLADIEIYVDGIANIQIQNLNSVVDFMRQKILERFHPKEEDTTLKTLSAAHINQDEYFSHVVQHDISQIIRDIRAAHAQDDDTASTQSPVDELKEDLEFASNFKGSKAELQLIIICKRLGINYKSLTPLETQILIGVLGKSPLAKSPINRRKRHK